MNPLRRLWRRHRLARCAGRLSRLASRSSSPGEWFDLLGEFPDFRPLQNKVEIVGLLERVAELSPGRVLEIGSWHGGTGFLFGRVARENATIVLADTGFDDGYLRALPGLMRAQQRVACLAADTHRCEARSRIVELLAGPIDFLFVDGDHSLEGVRADFVAYSPLVRAGGLIAFHDIVPDHRQRFGRDAPGDSGEVWKFWAELKARFPEGTEELIRDPHQDGGGIGVLSWDGGAVRDA